MPHPGARRDRGHPPRMANVLDYVVRETRRRFAVADYVRDFVDVPRFRGFCEACQRYGENWACPPFDFDPLDVWARYRWLHLTAFIMEFTPAQPRSGLDHDRLVADVMEMFHQEKRRAHHRLMKLRAAVPDSVGLGAGGCDVCPVCTRKQGLPCRLPGQLVHSIESLGGDVEATMRVAFEHPTQWSDGTDLPDSYVLVMGLLCDQEELPDSAPVDRPVRASVSS